MVRSSAIEKGFGLGKTIGVLGQASFCCFWHIFDTRLDDLDIMLGERMELG